MSDPNVLLTVEDHFLIDDPDKPIPVGFAELMMVVPRPLLIISTEQEFYRHKVFPKCFEALQVYLNWRDVDGMPSVVKARLTSTVHDPHLTNRDRTVAILVVRRRLPRQPGNRPRTRQSQYVSR